MAESVADKKARAGKILTRLAKAYPDARIALDFTTPLELLVATILSAQCTDERVNAVTAGLFPRYRRRRGLGGGAAAGRSSARSTPPASSGPRPGRSSGWPARWWSATGARCPGRSRS